MIGPKAFAAQVRGMGAYLRKAEMARELDPDAFKPAYVPHFTDQQLARQQDAFRAVEANLRTHSPAPLA